MPEQNGHHRIVTPTLIIGVPGAGKTSLLATFARYLWETYKRVLLLYSWDGGAIPTDLQKLVKQGLVRFWRARTRSAVGLGIETLFFATKGYWPKQIDPTTGETSPAVDLVPALTTLYKVSCPKGHELAKLPTRAVSHTYCDGCKTQYPPTELVITESVHITRGFEQVGGVAFDSLSSMADVVMDHMDQQRGSGHIGGEKSSFGGVVASGSTKFGGNNRADVGFAQRIAKQCVHNSQSIPNLKEGPVFTALSMIASDEGGLPIVGAKLPGRAATDEASSWCGNVMEMGRTRNEQTGKEHFALFLRPFTDSEGRRHLLKTSASPFGVPDMLVDPIDKPWAQANLGLVLTMLDADLARAQSEEDIPDAPGIDHTPTRYGESFGVTQAAPQPVTEAVTAATPAAAPTARKRTRAAETAVATAPPPPGMKPPARAPGTDDQPF